MCAHPAEQVLPSSSTHRVSRSLSMGSPNIISSSVLELNGLGSSDPGLCTDLDVADAAGSNCKKRKELEPRATQR
jgi:hypothetical protein